MNIRLPEPLATYLDAEDTADVEVLGRCFAADAEVRDEGRTIRGLEAIKQWKSDSRAKYRYTVTPLGASQQDSVVTMPARLEGSFPGSPVEVEYTFLVVDGKIARLEIK